MAGIGPTEVKSVKSRDQELNPGAGPHLHGSDSGTDRREASVYQWMGVGAPGIVRYTNPTQPHISLQDSRESK